MIYVSLDIETTGLNPSECDILEIGAYIEDTNNPKPRGELPVFHCYVDKPSYRGELYALAMNAHIFKKIIELQKTQDPRLRRPDQITENFRNFLNENNLYKIRSKIIFGGKNVGAFDLPFIKSNIPYWNSTILTHHRHIDPGMLYIDYKNDIVPPDLKTCKQRAGLPELVSHEALDDSWDVIQLVRAKQ